MRWLSRSCLLEGLQGCVLIVERVKDLTEHRNAILTIADSLFESIDIQSLKISQRIVALQLLHLLISVLTLQPVEKAILYHRDAAKRS